MSNTMDKETKSNLEKAIAKQILDPIQSKYNDLKKQKKEKDIKDAEDKVTSKTSFIDLLDEATEENKTDYTDISDSSKPSGQRTTIPIAEKKLEPQLPPPPPVSQELVMSPPSEEFKSYLIGLKDSITDTDNGDDYEIDSNNQKELVQLVDDKLTWLESNPDASDDVIAKQQDQLRKIIEDKASSISETWHDAPEEPAPPAPPAPPADVKGRCIAESYEINPETQCNLETKKPLKREQFRLHPDKNPGCTEAATKKFQDLTNACEKYIVKQPEEETKEPEAQPEQSEEETKEPEAQPEQPE